MKTVKYVGDYEAHLPSIGVFVKPGDEIEVDDDFVNGLFVLVEENEAQKLKGDK